MEYLGIDVSSWQGKPEWKKAKSSIKYAILRVTERDGIDRSFEYNFKQCKKYKIPVGVYKYSYALSMDDIKAEAQGVVDTLKSREIDFPVWLDLEWEKQRNLPKSTLSAMIKMFRAIVIEYGYKFGIYCNVDWYENIIPDDCKKYDFWIASYPYDDKGVIVERLRPHYGVGWQYSSKGKVPGIEGNVDMDVFYTNFSDKKEDSSDFEPVQETGVTAEDALDVMRAWIGRNEADNSHRAIIDIYNSHKPLARGYKVSYSDSWCDVTISAVFISLSAVDLIGGTECGVEEHVKLFKKAGIWEEDGTIEPDPGYLMVFNWDSNRQPNDGYADHIAMVESCAGGKIVIIEGNYHDKVGRRVVNVGDPSIRGYARPKYAKRSNVPVTPQKPAETVTDAHRVLRKGDTGEDVKELQRLLNQHGYDLAVDGDFGRETYKSVKDYQSRHGLEVDGIVGKYTWKNLELQNFEKDIRELAEEVIAGYWGDGSERKKRLTAAGYDYNKIQAEVNKLIKGN